MSDSSPPSNPRDSLETRLRRVEVEKQGSYDKRTEHLDESGKALFINRLILEDSPYLLQHAHNPVNWYAWGAEAFETAAAENKPVFLSIGYSTCHWCHVMEVESFDNVAVAELLNNHFISIKLDREQYPDLDEIYMTGVQIMTGQGGWPMSNFLLPDGKPFFAATYFPAAAFMQLLQQIIDAWGAQQEELVKSATRIHGAIDRILSERKQVAELDPTIAETALQALLQREDRSFGGLAGAPKFPQEPLLLLLLDRTLRNRELPSLAFIERALEGMATGGIYDQVGGGFHRYSVDAQWLVPHFEKMLYNQSQLGLVYLRAYQLTHNDFLRRVCEQTLDYVLRDMQLPEGGFYSATDADSEGEEGTFFVWTPAQLQAALDVDELSFIMGLYDISEGGNFEGANILSLQQSLLESARTAGGDDFYERLDRILHKLYVAREQRIHPLRDDKLIVAWTAAMITTLAQASAVLDHADWLAAAEKAARLLWLQNVEVGEGSLRLWRIYLEGTVSIPGQLEDYVNLVEALITLFDVTDQSGYLQQAVAVMAAAFAEFWDTGADGFFLSPEQATGPQLTRSRNASDGATLSPIATAMQCLLLLRQRQARIEDRAAAAVFIAPLDRALLALNGALQESPLSHPSLLRVFALQQRGSKEPIQYAGEGLLRVTARKLPTAAADVEILLQLQPGWHLTAPQARGGAFVPLDLRMDEEEEHWQLDSCAYPAPTATLAQAEGEAVAIYTGTVQLRPGFVRTQLPADGLASTIGFALRVQLCNEQNCLLPEVLRFRL